MARDPWYYLPDSKIHGANMGPTWGHQDPGGPHVGHMKLAIWAGLSQHHTCVPFMLKHLDTLHLRQNGRYYADNIFKYIFLNEN